MKHKFKSFSFFMAMALLLLGVVDAWGQYGLYGSPDTSAYSTPQATPAPQQAVVYPPVQQQPIQPEMTGPSFGTPSGQAVNEAPSQYQQQPYQQQYQQPEQQQYAQPSQYGQPSYPAYHASATSANYQNPPAQQQPVSYYPQGANQQQFIQPSPQYSSAYQTPAPAPAPGINPQPVLTPINSQPQQNVASFGKLSPQPIAEPDSSLSVASGSCNEASCDAAPCCEVPCTLPWFASVSGLMLSRDQANRVWTSYQSNQEANQIMNTQDIHMEWAGGGEITFGRSFCCGTFGLEANYWQLAQVTGTASITNPNNVSTPLDMRYLEVGPVGTPELVSSLFDNVIEHRLRRQNEAYNVEFNALYYGQPGQGFAGHTVNWFVGARFLKFDDDLLFSSLRSGTWGAAGGVNEGYLADNIENNMVGFQVGFQARSPQWYRFSTFLTTKFGLFNNHIKNDFMLYRGDGSVARVQPASGETGSYPVHSTANVLSTIAEINLGVDWNLSERLSASIGYRVIAISGIGLADNQIPFYIVDIPEISRVDSNGDLLLHGAFASVTLGF